MAKFLINNNGPLCGEVQISGAKNAVLPLMAATILPGESCKIREVPKLLDVKVMQDILDFLGGEIKMDAQGTLDIDMSSLTTREVPFALANQMRASFLVMGPLLAREGYAKVYLPGGCTIGARPIELHIKGFEALGARVDTANGFINAHAKKMQGAHIYLDVVSVGATINVMLAACMAEGKTVLENAAKEPHVVDLANFLNSMGANIRGAGTDVIRIKGVPRLHGTRYAIIPDQIEAGTFMTMAAATHGDVTIKNVIPKHLESISAKLLEMGCQIHESDEMLRVVATKRLNATHVKTLPYPGFPTDLQPQITTALTIASGVSVVTESIFENRFKYVDELSKMGARVKVEGAIAIVTGRESLTGAELKAPDLRAGAALVTAGLMAEGFTTLNNIYFVERGYENFPAKLRELGAHIELVETPREVQKFRLKYA